MVGAVADDTVVPTQHEAEREKACRPLKLTAISEASPRC